MSVKQGIHKNLQLWRDKATNPSKTLVMNPYDVTELAREQIGNGFCTNEQWNPVALDRVTTGLHFGLHLLTSDPWIERGMLVINGCGGFEL